MKSVIIVFLSCLLCACETVPKTDVPMPANLIIPCEKIPNIKDKANMGDLLKYSIELMRQYNECAVRHDGLVEAVTKPPKKD